MSLVTTETILDEIKELDKLVNIQQATFAKEYATDGNGARAYKVAYPKANDLTSRTEASKLLSKPTIPNIIAKWREFNRLDNLGTKEGMIAHLKKQMEICGEIQRIDTKEGVRMQMVDPIGYKTAVTELNKIVGVYSSSKIEVDYSGVILEAENKNDDYLNYLRQKNHDKRVNRKTNRE